MRLSLVSFFLISFGVSTEFDVYPAPGVLKSKPVRPILDRPRFRLFRTQILTAARRGPDFAGCYALAIWGCGTSCLSMAVINEATGKVYDAPFKTLSYSADVHFPDGSAVASETFEPLVYRKNSRLLIVRGCPDTDDGENCALFRYLWQGDRFKLLSRRPASP